MKSWFALSVYLQWIQPWQGKWRNWREARRLRVDRAAFRRETASLTTPWRLAAWAEAHLEEVPDGRWYDPPYEPAVTWSRRKGGPADYAALADRVLAEHGFTTLTVTVIVPPLGDTRPETGSGPGSQAVLDPLYVPAAQEPDRWQGHVVAAVYDADAQGWLHFSNWGMFGLYRDLDDVADDISPRWGAYLVRDRRKGTVRWRRREA